MTQIYIALWYNSYLQVIDDNGDTSVIIGKQVVCPILEKIYIAAVFVVLHVDLTYNHLKS